ncbi:hypothetical protein LKO27_09930 [Tessaracoccus sp. OS52]|uniref:hypothetical protein n=1 Tax=Tessaracoccus sp. OS52 TaxID=2886691 RepID=UPI001D100FD5|nr:hypothetical protein [Tessaracoccus sp. OS52]MCC2593722.1 hypothetical protein [Tessaracoccus sp. OS52]
MSLVLVAVLLFVFLLLLLFGLSIASWFYAPTQPRFDRMEPEFRENRPSYEAVVARIDEVIAESPGVTRIGLTSSLLCRTIAGDETCEDASVADQELMRSVLAEHATWQARDPERVFMSFFGEDSPVCFLMYDTSGLKPLAYARDRGFHALRVIDEDWSLLGPVDYDQWDE